MTQGIRTDRRPMPAAQDETQTDDALNAAVVRLLTRPESKRPTEMAEPAEPAARVQGIDATLHRAVEAHRDEVERQMREGAETDGDVDANMDRLVALADVIRATPTPTLSDLRHKMIYLWAGKWPESGFFVGELRSTLDSIRRDIMKLADADTDACAASGPDLFADPNLHQGFIPMPAYRPTIFMNIQLAIPLEAQRLLDVAQAAFEHRVPAYSGFPQEERDAHIARMRAEYRLDQLEVLTWAEPDDEPVASQPLTDETIDSAIAAHRLARMQLDRATRGADEVAVVQDGGDTSDKAMAGARSAWQAAHETEEAAFETVLALRPHAPAGLAAMLRYIAETPALGELDRPAIAMRQLVEAAEAVAATAEGAKLPQSQVRKISGPAQLDPVLALIEEHRVAYAEWDRLDAIAGEILAGDPRHAPALTAAHELEVREVAAFVALTTARPATLAGVLALAEYLPGIIRQVSTLPEETDAERVLRNIAAALNGLVAPPHANIAPDPDRSGTAAGRQAQAEMEAFYAVSGDQPTLDPSEGAREHLRSAAQAWERDAHLETRAIETEAELARLTALGRPDA